MKKIICSLKKIYTSISNQFNGISTFKQAPLLVKHKGLNAAILYLKKRHPLYTPPTALFFIHLYSYLSLLDQDIKSATDKQNEKEVFFIHCCVWGDGYSEKFITYLLPSLLAQGNLPAISKEYNIVLLIHCDKKTQEKLLASSVIEQIKKYARMEFILIPETIFILYKKITHLSYRKKSQISDNLKYYLLGGLQTLALKKALLQKAYISFLMPDIVLSDSVLTTAFQQTKDRKIALTTTSRTNYQAVKTPLNECSNSEKTSLSISAPDLTLLQIDHLHPDDKKHIVSEYTQHFTFSARLFFQTREGFIIRAFHYHPILIDCKKLTQPILFDYLPIDNSILNQLIDNTIPYNQQIWVCDNASIMAIMELTNSTNKVDLISHEDNILTYLELINIVKNSIKKSGPLFDTPFNRYLISFRHQYSSSSIRKELINEVDDHHFFEQVYHGLNNEA